MYFLADTAILPQNLGAGSGFNIWQSLGGLLLVFGLLILFLKVLGRINRQRNPGKSNLLTVWHLGPKREIQVLQLGDEVHYIYRHEGAMVLLKQESLQQWEEFKARPAPDQVKSGLSRIFPAGLTLASRMRSSTTKVRQPGAPARVGDLLQSLES